MKVQLVLDIPKLKTTKEAQDFCAALAEYIVQCPWNRDESIHAITYTVPKKEVSPAKP